MDRFWALDILCRDSVAMISPSMAARVAGAFGRSLDTLGIEPEPVDALAKRALGPWNPGDKDTSGVRIKYEHKGDKAVFVYELAVKLALDFGLYGTIDHAMATPYHKRSAEIRYISCRAAIRLARLFGGQGGVDELRNRNPWIEERLFREQPFTGGKERLAENRDVQKA